MPTPEHLLQRWVRQVGPATPVLALAELVSEALGEGAAVFAVDADRNVVLWSEGAQALLGFTADEMVGQHCLKANRCESCMRSCGLVDHGAISGVDLVLHRQDSSAVPVQKYARALRAADGSFAGGVEILVPRRSARPGIQPERHPVDAVPLPSMDRDPDVVAFHGLISRSPSMHRAFEVIRNVGETDATVLIRGESGTGKELAARAVHEESARRSKPFLAVNCAALAPTLLESELFGHVRGAFTGAIRDRPGLFKQADGGTLFLDEVAEMPLDLQAKLLRVLQERTFVPVGGTEALKVDLRIVAATHAGLRQRVKEGTFREDLMYRLRVVPIFLPPLRERRGDVELLLWHLVHRQNERSVRTIAQVQPEAMRALLDHPWPGNVRELQNVVQYAFAVGRGPVLRLDELPPEFREDPAPPAAVRPAAARAAALGPLGFGEDPEAEAEAIRDALERAGGHVGEAARLLGMSRPTFWRHRKRLGI